jgi:isochorismate synthase
MDPAKVYAGQVAKKLPFVLFALPHEEQFTYLWDDKVHLDSTKASFIFKGFDLSTPVHQVIGEHRQQVTATAIHLNDIPVASDLNMDLGYAQMLDSASKLFKDTDCQKIVLSRKKTQVLPAAFDPLKLVFALHAQYPATLSYLLYHPACGTWIGATPETLIQGKDDQFTTMALAGTRPQGSSESWSRKDIDEHEFVCDHIDAQLAQMSASTIHRGLRKTMTAGPVEHLITEYSFKSTGSITSMVNALHPTPAICGTPRDLAYNKIRELEKHDRELYAGYIGPTTENNTHLFINLRCLKIEGQNATLFIGGGIIQDSQAELEWKETEMKAQTLLKVMQNL